MNLFDKAKTKTVVEAKKDTKKVVVEVLDPQFHTDLSRLAELNTQIDLLAAEAAILHDEIKNRGKKEFSKLYKSTTKNPGSFVIQAKAKDKATAEYMFIPTDNYIKIKDQERADYLNTTISPNLVVETTEFKFKAEHLEKYGEEISKAIEDSTLPEEVKNDLIVPVTSWKVAKGTIENFKTDKHLKKFDVDTLVEEIQPIFQVKGVKVK